MKRIATLFLVLLLLMSAAFAEDAVENDALTAIGDELLDRTRTLLSDETYEAMFGFGEDILALRAQWAEEMADEQVRPEVYTHPQFSLLYNLLFALDMVEFAISIFQDIQIALSLDTVIHIDCIIHIEIDPATQIDT